MMRFPLLLRAICASFCALCVPQIIQAADRTPSDTVELSDVKVTETVRLLDQARNSLSTDTGSSIYGFDTSNIENLPLGASTPLNQVILQAPGVTQDSFGQMHIRGDHGNVQYRVNGVVIPEAISGFGQSLDTRLVDRLDILTGALPAQYGYRTAGVVDIHTKGTAFRQGVSIDLTGGSHDDREIGASISGSNNTGSYFLSGSYLRNELGIENPTSARDALHDLTRQAKGFGYLSYGLSDQSRVSVMFGVADNRFQIPDVPNQDSRFALSGVAVVNSAALDANQREQNRFAVLSYQGRAMGRVDYQVSLFHRYTEVDYDPDWVGDLSFDGVAARIARKDQAAGLQLDSSYHLGATHTLRAGLFYSDEHFSTHNSSRVFPADPEGNQTGDVPLAIIDEDRLAGSTEGVYLQDEWQPLTSLTLNFGARFDKVDTVVDERQLSPRFGLVYDLSGNTRVHAGYARYFTPPPTERIDTTSVQKFLDTTNSLPSDANTAVSSERSHYFDLGLAQQLTPRATIGLDAYYRRVTHLQDEGQFGRALIFSAFNFAQGRVWGAELSSSYHGSNLSGYFNSAYSVARARNVVTGQFNFDAAELQYVDGHWVHLDHDQRWSGSGGLSYQWHSTTFSADALSGSGLRRGFANTDHMPSYVQVNLALVESFDLGAVGKMDGRLAVINLLDRVYELRDGSGIGVGAPQFAPRRAIYVGVSKTF